MEVKIFSNPQTNEVLEGRDDDRVNRRITLQFGVNTSVRN